eukprot:291622_1
MSSVCTMQHEVDYNKNLRLNATQYKLKWNIYCHHCYQILNIFLYHCPKCKLFTYCDEKCFQSNWRYHGYTCAIVTNDQQQKIAKLPSQICMKKIKQTLFKPSSKLVYYLKRIHYILKQGESDDTGDIGMDLHTSQRIHSHSKESLIKYINILWSCYGMAEFVLNVPIIRYFRCKLYSEYGFPPEYSKLEDNWDELHDKIGETNDSYELTFFVVNFLCNAITTQGTQMRPGASCWDHYQSEFLSINDVPMFNVVCKRIFEIWSDIHVIEDCGDALAPIINVIETFVSTYGENKYKMNKIIGCDFKYLILNTTIFDSCINEMLSAHNKRAATSVLEYIVKNINYDILWLNDKRIASYYILLISHGIDSAKSYIDYEESSKINFNFNNLHQRQIELLRTCADKIIFQNDKYNKQKQLLFVTKYILLYHGRLRRPESV